MMAYYRNYRKVSAATARAEGTPINTVDVFAAACAAQRINGSYVIESKYVEDPQDSNKYITVLPNKELVRNLLNNATNLVTDADRKEADAVQGYWKLKLFAVMCGNASDYVKCAVEAAGQDTVMSTDFKTLAIISSLPSAYDRGIVRDKIQEERQEIAYSSSHIGEVGKSIKGQVKILECNYSKTWNRYYVTGVIDTNLVFFGASTAADIGKTYQINAKVKSFRDDNTTQLNYVKLS